MAKGSFFKFLDALQQQSNDLLRQARKDRYGASLQASVAFLGSVTIDDSGGFNLGGALQAGDDDAGGDVSGGTDVSRKTLIDAENATITITFELDNSKIPARFEE